MFFRRSWHCAHHRRVLESDLQLQTFARFDELLVLHKGQPIYYGPVGAGCAEVLQYFDTIEGFPAMPESASPALHIQQVPSETARFGYATKHCSIHEQVIKFSVTARRTCVARVPPVLRNGQSS